MESKNTGGAIALSILIVGAIGAIVYFLLRKKKVKDDAAAASKPAPINQNVSSKISAGFEKSLSVLTPTEVKKYAGWLDKAESIAAGFVTQKGSDPQLVYNLTTVTNFPDNNFRTIVQNWKSVRGISDLRDTNMLKALGNLIDPSYDAVNDFYAKTVKLKIS
ncbi:hypothetical protein ACFSR6_03310 [Pedobacter vanadiisoli]|uniref:LPXTG-motif cell wall-anchored protein n=1 Tax=Pedobacter vanadiisoli TaxID=1761975 RepID=A0ABW5ME65_9SPHI